LTATSSDNDAAEGTTHPYDITGALAATEIKEIDNVAPQAPLHAYALLRGMFREGYEDTPDTGSYRVFPVRSPRPAPVPSVPRKRDLAST
jgi:hypothetical protein